MRDKPTHININIMARQFEKLTTNEQLTVLNDILSNYKNLTLVGLRQLIDLTQVKGVKFVSIKGYCSAASGNSELADQLINVGASYENMLTKDAVTFDTLDINTIDIDSYNYATINMAGLTIDQFKKAVKESLSLALYELQNPTKKAESGTVDNDIALNKALLYNMNTKNLGIFGQQVNKTVHVKGDVKIVKSAPKTVAKQIIQNLVNSRTSKLRRFTLSNIANYVVIDKNKIEFV
jgi:hypothetical protein